ARAEGASGRALGSAALAAIVTLTAYAFFGVARFSAKYGARSVPCVAIGRDRLVVSPWVSRGGAIDERPEGRIGAAIPLGEVRSAVHVARDDAFAVEVDTEHGPIDALVASGEDVAILLRSAIERAIAGAAHPNAGASAKQRARARAQLAVKPARG